MCAPYFGSSVPACSATMYAAYQSGQFGSAAPMRFSCSPCAIAARFNAFTTSATELYDVVAGSTRPGNRAVISCTSQPLPSGSVNVANELYVAWLVAGPLTRPAAPVG